MAKLAGSLPADDPYFDPISAIVKTPVISRNHGVASLLKVAAEYSFLPFLFADRQVFIFRMPEEFDKSI
jgi:hypothetical protein